MKTRTFFHFMILAALVLSACTQAVTALPESGNTPSAEMTLPAVLILLVLFFALRAGSTATSPAPTQPTSTAPAPTQPAATTMAIWVDLAPAQRATMQALTEAVCAGRSNAQNAARQYCGPRTR